MVLLVSGCGGPTRDERAVVPTPDPLPESVRAILPEDVEICGGEKAAEGLPYCLWILHSAGSRASLDLQGLEGLEEHELPAATLIHLIQAKAPRVEVGAVPTPSCRFAHWAASGHEYRVRQVVTSRGWFASLEQLPR